MDTIIRKLNQLGRVHIPKRLRVVYEIPEGSEVSIVPTDEGILIRKLKPSCLICRGEDDLIELNGKWICSSCLAKLNDAASCDDY